MNLLGERRFAPYFLTQFLGAFNDNVFKNALLILLAFKIVTDHSNILVNVAAIVFILPFFLCSPLAGQLADKYEKSGLIRNIKWLEITIMALGVLGLYLNSIALLMTVLFLMGAQSAFFGPIKFSILPQHLNPDELMGGNALVEAGTFLAILFGTILGGVLAGLDAYVLPVSLAILGFALLGRLTSHFIPPAQAEQPDLIIDYNPVRSGKAIFALLASDKTVLYTVLGISWFWFFGATVLTQIPNFAKQYLNGTPQIATLLMAMFSIGIALGSLLASKLSRGRVEIGLVPFGAIGMAVFGVLLGAMDIPLSETQNTIGDMLTDVALLKVLLVLILLAMSGGIYIVPLYVNVQHRTPIEYLSRNIAALSMLNALFMVIAGIFAIVYFKFSDSIQGLIITVAVLHVAVTASIFSRVPEFLRLLPGTKILRANSG